MVKYVLNSNIALRSWWLVPHAYYVKGIREAAGLKAEEFAFLSACVCSESKYYYTFGAGIPILEFLLLMLSNMGDKLKNLKYFTIYSLFPGDKIVSGGDGYLPNLLAMAGIAIVLYVAGILWFRKRDFSV